jgi:hypothetical protein
MMQGIPIIAPVRKSAAITNSPYKHRMILIDWLLLKNANPVLSHFTTFLYIGV